MAVDESHALLPDPLCVLTPGTHAQVQKTVQWALDYDIALVPSGGRTGLSGGACAGNNEVVLSLAKMNRIISFDTDAGLITVEAGVVLETLQNTVADQGWFYPVDYASRGSAQMGGAVATNAGGIRVLRYGMTRDWITGLKAVTGTGQTLAINRHLEKDNAGYNLKHLLAGSEGTLAVITEITFRLTRPMREQTTLLAGFESMSSMLVAFLELRKSTELNAAEFFCANALKYVTETHCLSLPFGKPCAFYLLIECDEDKVFLDAVAGIFEDDNVLISHSYKQAKSLWRYRELVSSTLNPLHPYKNDIACSFASLPDWFAAIKKSFIKINAGVELVWFGHLGDGNVHINVIKPPTMTAPVFEKLLPLFSQSIAEITARYMATASAEHGIGYLKKSLLPSSRSVVEMDIYKHIKKIFDPQGILNPGKLIPVDSLPDNESRSVK